MDLTPNFEQAPAFKPLINIGALLDIPTGTYVVGRHGESILNGGLGMLTGVVGIGNNFKSTILHCMMLTAMARITQVARTAMSTYDTEINIHESHLEALADAHPEFEGRNLFATKEWVVTDRTVYHGNKWFELFKEYTDNKVKALQKLSYDTPFVERDLKSPFRMITPTFGELDSLSDFQTEDVAKIQDDNEIGEAGGNTMHMRQGLAKQNLLMQLPAICGKSNHYLGITAQVGKGIEMASGPMAPPPVKKLQYLKNGDKLKGVTDKFFFLMSNCWHAYNASPLYNSSSDKTPMYPRAGEKDNEEVGTDLNKVTLRQLRSKSGPTGITIELLVSQTHGILNGLTEFHFIKDNDRFGISGSLQHYSLDLYPDVKLSRTTVRGKIDEDPVLRRALNITAELLQMRQMWTHMDPELLCTAQELYDDLKAKGYDWNVLLATRGWWTLDNDKHPVPFLSTMDLLRMRSPKYNYHPYWMKKSNPLETKGLEDYAVSKTEASLKKK